MSKYEIAIAQVKVITVEVEGKNSDDAVFNAKQVTLDKDFECRIGAKVVAGVREIKE